MTDIDDLYRDVILDHFRNPRNHGRVTDPQISVEGVNPFCGDQIQLTAKVQEGRILDICVEGKGCSISQSSASMMTEALKGRTLARSQELVGQFKRMMLGNASGEDLPEELEDLAALEGVKKYPVRVKCALLAWNTVLEGISEFEKNGTSVVKQHTEE
ncbi:MAG: SUF system NifU family Fe-S cluster assembly protein [Elusimicrobia bacterium]|nr:SUF system NifU family Fe-S cluster assembly protein [Elusimicrobiota bacterium]